MVSQIEDKITNNDQILPFTNIRIFHKHQRNFINTGGWHAFPCVIPPTTELTISWNQSATPPYNILNTLVRSEVMGDLLKITFHPPKRSSWTLIYPTDIKDPFGISLRSLMWPPCLKDKALCDVNEPTLSASGTPCKDRQEIFCQNLSDSFCYIPGSLNKFTSYQRQ